MPSLSEEEEFRLYKCALIPRQLSKKTEVGMVANNNCPPIRPLLPLSGEPEFICGKSSPSLTSSWCGVQAEGLGRALRGAGGAVHEAQQWELYSYPEPEDNVHPLVVGEPWAGEAWDTTDCRTAGPALYAVPLDFFMQEFYLIEGINLVLCSHL